MHGAGLVRAMQEKRPGLHFFGVGGSSLIDAGVEALVDVRELSVMGFTEVFSSLHVLRKALRKAKKEMNVRRPALVILVDFADFNLRLAKAAHGMGIPVFYYIPPKVWVWRKHRVKQLAKYVTCAAVILPFEEAYLQDNGVRAKYVGNPVSETIQPRFYQNQFSEKYSIDNDRAIIGIFPGSRKKEVALLLPIFLEAARRMQKKYSKELTFVIPLAPTMSPEDLEINGLAEYRKHLDIHLIAEDRYELMASCDAAVAASGTVTLELALLSVPMVVAYKLSPVSYGVGKLMIDLPFFSLVNLISKKEVVTELLQNQVTPGSVEIELARVLFDEDVRAMMRREYNNIKTTLGQHRPSPEAAELALHTLDMG
ncbi:unnamed protein product [Cyprideis torosa]|uniref:lipid-A-disaccharide synthase n=1 Tax=Cyprideis torosa TaxID=163714 RepID=A0A7R8WH35_9CRUS|nr:unnamed protein product [Cyprideis torosa]CAG0898891.1 unnamed protein product [Cyprideis torosa]